MLFMQSLSTYTQNEMDQASKAIFTPRILWNNSNSSFSQKSNSIKSNPCFAIVGQFAITIFFLSALNS